MRVVAVPSLMSAPQNWRYESGLLLTSKLGEWAHKTGLAHVHLAVPGRADYVQQNAHFTLHDLGSLLTLGTMSSTGYVADLRGVLRLIEGVGPDVVVVTHSRMAAMLGTAMEGDALQRAQKLVPLVLWDLAPDGTDLLERGPGHGGRSVAFGYASPDLLISSSAATERSGRNEVMKHMGYSAVSRMMEHAKIVKAVFSQSAIRNAVPERSPKRQTFTVHIGGRWSKSRNFGAVCKAVFELRALGHPIELLWTGPIRGNKGTDGSAAKLLAECQAEVIEGLNQEDMWQLSSSCHLGVITQDLELIPCMMLEQLALGLPVLIKTSRRLGETMPEYPFVWNDERELLPLVVDVMQNYGQRTAEAIAWFDEHASEYDVDRVGEELIACVDLSRGTSVPVAFDAAGIPSLGAAMQARVFFASSLFRQTLVRREALRLGYVERLDDPVPKFEKLEEA